METESSRRLIVVSNRLPYVLEKNHAENHWTLKPGSGGLVTALLPVLRDRGGIWIGWSGVTEEVPEMSKIFKDASRDAGYDLKPVSLTAEEVENYYDGYSNGSVWPLFHDLQSQCVFEPAYWQAYTKVNSKFATVIAAECRGQDFVWVHDYQLMDVANHLRESGNRANLAFFLHVPFPAPDIFMKLPERSAVLTSLLAHDLVGFQTQRDRRNFIHCVRTLVKNARVTAEGHLHVVRIGDREMRVGSFPIGIDAGAFAKSAADTQVEERVRVIHSRYTGRQIVLGLDRLDYTKGIPQRIRAFANLIERFPEVRGRIHLFQVVVPSREGIQTYDELKLEMSNW